MNRVNLITFLLCFFILNCNSDNNSTDNKIIPSNINSIDSDDEWLPYQKDEFKSLFKPFAEKYGALGEEFTDLLCDEISKDWTYNEANNLSEKDGAKYFESAMLKTSKGWSIEAEKNFKISCGSLLANQGFTMNIENLCDCSFNKLIKNYHNPLIFDFYKDVDTLQSYYLRKCLLQLAIDEMQ